MHRPAYTPSTPETYRVRLDRMRALREQPSIYPYSSYSYNYGYPYYGYGFYPYGSLNGYWYQMMFFNAGFYCDPFSLWPCYLQNPNGLYALFGYPFSALGVSAAFGNPCGGFGYGLGYPYGVGYPYGLGYPYGVGYPFGLGYSYGLGYPYSGNLSCNSQVTPLAANSSSYCPLCTVNGSQFGIFALDNPFLLTLSTPPPAAPLSLSNRLDVLAPPRTGSATSPGSATAASGLFGASYTAPDFGQPTAYAEPDATAAARPVSLVFKNGSTVQARNYWLAGGKLHYVSGDGIGHSIPLGQLDMRATMKANRQNGVRFLPPAASPQTVPGQEQQQDR